MGDNFLKRQAENFKKGRDLAIGELGQPTLWSQPEVVQTVFTAIPGQNCKLESGEVLTVYPSADATSVSLVRGHRIVGRIGGDAGISLLGVLNKPGTGGMAHVKVTDVSGLSGVGKAVIVEG